MNAVTWKSHIFPDSKSKIFIIVEFDKAGMAEIPSFRGSGSRLSFPRWLQKTKESGSNILVTGKVPREVSAQASRALFGRNGDRRRYRILGLIGRESLDADARLPSDTSVDDSDTWVIDQCSSERSPAATASDVTGNLEPLDTGDFRQLCTEIQTAIGFYEGESGGLDPAELRVGVDSLELPVEQDLPATKNALRSLTASVHGVNGMAHYHLRRPDDAESVEELASLFEARIELRKRPKLNPEQRWHVPELGRTTEWIEL